MARGAVPCCRACAHYTMGSGVSVPNDSPALEGLLAVLPEEERAGLTFAGPYSRPEDEDDGDDGNTRAVFCVHAG